MSDGTQLDEDQVLIEVVANRQPVAVDDLATTNQNTAVNIPVLSNDSDPDGDTLTVTGFTQGTSGSVSITNNVATYTPNAGFGGSDSFGYTISDGHGGSASATVTVKVNKIPVVTAGAVETTITLPATASLTGTATDDALPDPPALLTITWTKQSGPGMVTFGDEHALDTTASFSEAGAYVLRLTAGDGQLSGHAEVSITVNPAGGGGGLPPDPATVAPLLSRTSITPFGKGTEFLYTGPDPIQTGVAPGTIDPRRAAVIRGRVLDRAEAPLGGVMISILNHPELGQTLSRADGMFDLAVNGGGALTLRYEKTGFFSAQRLITVPWQDYVFRDHRRHRRPRLLRRRRPRDRGPAQRTSRDRGNRRRQRVRPRCQQPPHPADRPRRDYLDHRRQRQQQQSVQPGSCRREPDPGHPGRPRRRPRRWGLCRRRRRPEHAALPIARDGILHDLGGGGTLPDGSLATDVGLPCGDALFWLATTPDGQILYSSSGCYALRRIDQNGRVRTLAGILGQGRFTPDNLGDGGPATQVTIGEATHLTVTPDGSVYFIDTPDGEDSTYRVRRITPRFPGFAGLFDQLLVSRDGREIYRFDSSGRHLATLHALTGAVLWSFGYDPAGRLVTVTDGDGNVTTIERDGAGAPTAIVGPFGQRTILGVDGAGYLASVANPAAEAYQFGYTPTGLMTSMRTPKNQLYTFTHDPASGRVLTDTDPAGGSQTLARTDLAPSATLQDGHEVTRTTGLGRLTRYRVEGLLSGDRREVNTAPDGTSATALYDKSGTMTLSTADGTTTTRIESADPRFGMLAPLPSQVQVVTPAGRMRTIAQTRISVLSDPVDLLSLVQLTETFTLNGRTTTATYDAATRQVAQTTPGNRQGTRTIDALERVTASQFGGLAPSAYTYDARGRLATMTARTGAEARTWTFTYNPESYVETITDPLARVTSFTYDGAGRVLTQTRPDLRVITYSYDANGNLASLTPPGRPAHTFAYSPVDLETEYNPPDVPGVVPDDTDTTYNIDRQVTGVARPDGKAITPTYDAAGRVASMGFSRGSVALAYSATTGLVIAMTAPDSVSHALTYDGRLLTQHALSGPIPGTVAWTYDDDFRVESQSVDGGNTVSFTYDADSLLTQAGALGLARSAQHGLLTGTTLGVVTDTLTYNSHAEVLDHRAQVSGADVYRAELTRDALGRITQKIETILGTADTYDYTYDLAGRLTGVTKNAVAMAYTYDDNGNRESYTGPLGNVAAVDTVYDAQDRLTQYGATSFTYDQHGDLATKVTGAATTTYTYDEFGNLTRVVLPGPTTIDYVIDGLNRRIGKKLNTALTQRWLYDGRLRIVAELDGAGTLVSRFVYATRVNVPDYMVRGGATYRIVTGYLGSPRLVIDRATGAVAQQMNHDEFGRLLQDTNPGFIPFGFAGGLYDPDTGFVRFGARDYDPAIGRWTAKDPIGFRGSQASLYAYASADPVNHVDRNGHLSTEQPPMSDYVLTQLALPGQRGAQQLADHLQQTSADRTAIRGKSQGVAESVGGVIAGVSDMLSDIKEDREREANVCPAKTMTLGTQKVANPLQESAGQASQQDSFGHDFNKNLLQNWKAPLK